MARLISTFIFVVLAQISCTESPPPQLARLQSQVNEVESRAAKPLAPSNKAENNERPPPAERALPTNMPMLLDFTRDHCMPCEIMAPWVEKLRKRHEGKIGVLEINIDRPENRRLQKFFKVLVIPTQVYVNGRGEVVNTNAGLATLDEMAAALEKHGLVGKAKITPPSTR